MKETEFFRVIEPDPDQKAGSLVSLVQSVRAGDGTQVSAFQRSLADLAPIPGTPFAYWVPHSIVQIFRDFSQLEGGPGTVRQGLATADDFRFVRAWWEVTAGQIGYCAGETTNARGWVHFAKGGSYSPYFADVHLLVDWLSEGAAMKQYVIDRYPYVKGKYQWVVKNEEYYFRAGLTWPLRTSGLSFRPFPTAGAFGHKGPVAFCVSQNLFSLLGVMNSGVFEQLVRTQVARTELAQSFEVGLISKTPVPSTLPSGDPWEVASVVSAARWRFQFDETAHDFGFPSLLMAGRQGLTESAQTYESKLAARAQEIEEGRARIEREVRKLYGLPEEPTPDEDPLAAYSADDHDSAESSSDSEEEDEVSSLENGSERAANLLQWCVGVAFGRWDVRVALDQSLLPELQGPFERLPRVAPGGLVGPDGFPATEDRIASEGWLRARPNVITLPEPGSVEGSETILASEYPIDVAWDGILVDDPDHRRDIVRKVREVLRVVWGDQADAIEEEALSLLQGEGNRPKTLRDWFRNQKASDLGKNFFDFHIQRYSKSRRKAPIYWRLCSNSGRGQAEYAVWLYWHRVTDDTLWTVVGSYVGPKRALEERRLEELREQVMGADGRERSRLEEEVEAKKGLVAELMEFERTLRAKAEEGWVPEKDDGVVVNLAPLRELVPWGEPAKVWKKLEAGDYDWAMTAMRHWPDRVREKCQSDKSLAIAHGIGASAASDSPN
ncbi:hypothetical protein ACFL5T_03570 [Gemmatimonadota bacterium]